MDSTILNLYNCLLHKIVLQGCHKQMIVFSRNEGFHALLTRRPLSKLKPHPFHLLPHRQSLDV